MATGNLEAVMRFGHMCDTDHLGQETWCSDLFQSSESKSRIRSPS